MNKKLNNLYIAEFYIFDSELSIEQIKYENLKIGKIRVRKRVILCF